jgi:hypothetical protein
MLQAGAQVAHDDECPVWLTIPDISPNSMSALVEQHPFSVADVRTSAAGGSVLELHCKTYNGWTKVRVLLQRVGSDAHANGSCAPPAAEMLIS